jgi:hypothetical protein
MHVVRELVKRNDESNQQYQELSEVNNKLLLQIDSMRISERSLEEKVKLIQSENSALRKKIAVLEWKAEKQKIENNALVPGMNGPL